MGEKWIKVRMKSQTSIGDKELLLGLQRGDEVSFATLYNRYSPSVYLSIIKLVKEREVALDIVQDLFFLTSGKTVRPFNIKTMGQPSEHIEKLLEKYVNNLASPDEVQELIGYFDTDELTLDRLLEIQLREAVVDEDGLDSCTKDLLSERLDRIKSEIQRVTITEFPTRRRWISRQTIKTGCRGKVIAAGT